MPGEVSRGLMDIVGGCGGVSLGSCYGVAMRG